MESNYIYMNKKDLKKLSKGQLIKMLLKQSVMKPKPVPAPRTYKPVPALRTYKPRPPVPTPRKSVKQMVQDYEDNKPVPAPRTKKHVVEKPVPAPRTKIEQKDKALSLMKSASKIIKTP